MKFLLTIKVSELINGERHTFLNFALGGLALCLRGSTEERGQIIFDMVIFLCNIFGNKFPVTNGKFS